ncbi:MAG: hypothetical protein H6822_18875 [Planctomycetaceae bacterium]|nr:hypothetical protein [Planctomycetales bacterium]MCB9924252.1 hypothetical protein [Planctomycetaceae bacterium]
MGRGQCPICKRWGGEYSSNYCWNCMGAYCTEDEFLKAARVIRQHSEIFGEHVELFRSRPDLLVKLTKAGKVDAKILDLQ